MNTTTNNTPDTAPAAGPEKNTLMAVLAYIGPLAIVSFLVAKDDPFVKYHVKQGFVLLTIEVALYFLTQIFPIIWPLIHIAQLATLILAIMGIINAVGGNEKELPLVGKYASHFKI